MDGPAQGKAAFSAFHIKTFGEKRWKKLYRALRQPTSHVALVNPYVPAQWIAKELARLRAVPVTALPEAFMKDMPVYALPDAPASPEQQELYNIDEDARWPGELPRVGSMPGDMQYFTALSGEDVPGPHVFGGLFGRVGWYLLDAASLCAPLVLNPQPGEKVLDVCAAPGGKSLVMSYLLYARAELAASKSGVAAAMKRWAEHESLQLRLGFAPDAAAAAASAATAAAAAPTKAASDDGENEVFPASRDGFFEPTWVLSDEDPAALSPGPLLTVTDSQSMARKGAGTGVDVTVTGLGGVAKPTVITAASAAVVGAKAALGTNPTINPAIVPGAVAKGAAFSAVAKEAAAAKAAAKAASSAKAADGEAAPVSTPLEEEVRDDDSVVVFAPDAPAPAPISAAAVAAAAAATGDAIPELVPADATAADLPASSVPAPAAAPAGGNGASEIKGEGGHVTLAAATAAAAEASAAAHAAAAANYQAARLTAGEGAKVARRSKLVLNDVSRSRTERLRQVVRDYLPFSLMPSVDVVNIDATTVTSFGAVTYSGSGKQQLASASAAAGGKADKGSTAVAALPPAGEFDCVLLDAPCSSDRHVVHDPEALAHWTTQVTRTQAKRQISLLDTSVRALKVGGRCVYSTCSLSPLENDGAVAAVLKKYPEMLKVVKFKLPIGEATKLGWILLPDQPGCVWGPLYICYLHRIA